MANFQLGTVKICKDCQFYKKSFWDGDNCQHPQSVFVNPINGKTHHCSCSSMRSGICGWDAKLFEKKKTP